MIKPFIYNSDIKAIEKKAEKQSLTPDEAELLRHKGLSESKIQQACRQIFLSKFGKEAKFIQIDNGGKMGIAQRIKKSKEGTEEGAKDVILIGSMNRSSHVEFKKVGSPSEIDPTEKQKEMHDFLLWCGHKAYYCNNTVYFRKIICEEFKNL